tara:strand:+ start:377 stop:835 length:459 start_codon:yes stop_codon:yes gene_type:complete
MIKINVLIENKSWIKYIKNPENYFKKKIKKLNNNIIFKNKKIEFSLLLSGSKIITKLNLKFRKKDKATDVLSFPSNELLNSKKKGKKSFIYIGDIVINLNKLKINLNEKNFFLKFDETWIHGLAHLLGHKHKSKKDYLVMKKVENKFLRQIN